MTDPPTPEEEEALAALTILDFFAYLVDDDDAAAARERHCEAVSSALENVASWLAVDAWLGAGDVQDTSAADQAEADPVRRRSFVAVGLVAQISSELVSGALLLFRNGNEYAASALVRQLIECEYLLRAFGLNFAEAARWHDANDSERWDFTPSKLRKIGGFDRKEYAAHCESGGHPHPSGRQLMELPRSMGRLEQAVSGETRALDTVRALWLDFTFHCDRTWRALTVYSQPNMLASNTSVARRSRPKQSPKRESRGSSPTLSVCTPARCSKRCMPTPRHASAT
jgi:hypothetical protein